MRIVKRNAHRGPWVLLVGLFLAASGCAPGTGSAGNPLISAAAEEPVLLNVTNHYSSPMHIYVRGSGTSHLLGTVLPGQVGHFVVRHIMVVNGPIEFVAQANDRHRTIRSESTLLLPGDIVDFTISKSPIPRIATVRS